MKKPPPVVGEGKRGEVKTNELGGRLKAAKSRAMSRLIILSVFGTDRGYSAVTKNGGECLGKHG